MLDEYPESYKLAFGISTLSQADLNRVHVIEITHSR